METLVEELVKKRDAEGRFQQMAKLMEERQKSVRMDYSETYRLFPRRVGPDSEFLIVSISLLSFRV